MNAANNRTLSNSMKPLDACAFDSNLLKRYLPNLQRFSIYVLFRRKNVDGKADQ